MAIIKRCVYTVLIMFLVLLIYCYLFGNPLERARFKGEAVDYLNQNFGSISWKLLSVDYNFKEGDFTAQVKSDSGVKFLVKKDASCRLYDNYVYSVWADEIRKKTLEVASGVFGEGTNVLVNIVPNHKIYLSEEGGHIPLYSEVSNKFSQLTTVTIFTKSPPSNKESAASNCYKIISWIKDNKYYSNVVFVSNKNKVFLDISSVQLNTITDIADITRFFRVCQEFCVNSFIGNPPRGDWPS